jgi:hypothetical protein
MLIELVKSMFVELEADSMMIPWIYLCYNRDMALIPGEAKLFDPHQKKGVQSANSSKLIVGTSTNVNKSAGLMG